MSTSAIVTAVVTSGENYADRTALICGEDKVSYRELLRRAQSAAAHIARLAPGENIGIFLPNSIDFPPHVLGALWAGKITAVLPTLAPAPLVKLMFAEAKLTMVLTSPDLAPRLAEAGVPYFLVDPTYPPAKEFVLQTRPHQAALLLYTSGTTGRPKAVALSEQNIISNVEGCKEATGFDDRQVMLAILPLFHAYGLTVTNLLPLMTGSTVVVLQRFVPRTVLNAIESHRVTTLVAVPSQYRLLAQDPTPCDANSLWLCVAGAERLPETTEREFTQRFGHAILPGYGATEVAPVISLNIPETNRPASVGRPLPNLQVTIRRENDSLCPVGEIGEVCVEGPNVMLGYPNDPEATLRKLRNGTFHTGDRGFTDADGYIYLAGRADEMVKVAGETVYPSEVENALEKIEGVEEAAVLALPDQKHGVRLHAFVQTKQGSLLDASLLRAACHELLEPHKVPRSFTFVDSLPRTITGKTDKRTLVASAA